MYDETIELLREILDERIDTSKDTDIYLTWCTARDIIEYALADNIECLKEFYMGVDKSNPL